MNYDPSMFIPPPKRKGSSAWRGWVIGIACVLTLGLAISHGTKSRSPSLSSAAHERMDLCAPVGDLAARAWAFRQRGASMSVAIQAATSQVTNDGALPFVRRIVEIGYEADTQEAARQRAVTSCAAGLLH